MTDKRVKDFIQDISGQFSWMSIASGNLTDEEYMLLEQQATQAGLSVEDIMHEATKWNGKPLPKSERYSMRQTPSRRKAANIRNRRSRYEPEPANRNRIMRASSTDFGWITIEDTSIDYDDLKEAGERFGVKLNNVRFGNTNIVAAYKGSQENIISLADFLGGSLRLESEDRTARRSTSRAPFYEFNKRAGMLGGDDFDSWLVNIDMNNVDIKEVADAIVEYAGEDQVKRWAIGEDDGGEYPYEVDEALDSVGDVFMYSSIPGLVRNELIDRFVKTSNSRFGRNRNRIAGIDEYTDSLDVMTIEELLDDYTLAVEQSLEGNAMEARSAIRAEIERRAQGHTANRARLNNRKAAMRNKRTSFYGKTSNTLYELPVEAFDESELEWIKRHLRSFGLSFMGADFSDHGDSTVFVEGSEDQVIEYLKDYTDETDLEPEDGEFFYWQELAEDIGIRTSNRKNRQAGTRRAQMARHSSGRVPHNPNEKDIDMNRDRRNRTASGYDRLGYAPRNRNRTAAEIDRLRRARAASRRRARRLDGDDRTAARRKTAQELYRTYLDILYPEDIPDIEAEYGVTAVQTGVGYHNQEAIFEGTREALLQMLKDNHVGPEFAGDPEEDWLEKVSSNTNEKDTNMNRNRRNRMANRTRIAGRSPLERNIAQLTLAVRRLAAIQAKIDNDSLEDVSKDIENVEEPVEEPKEIDLDTEDLNEQPESADDAKEEESEDENPVVDSEVVAKRPIRMASRPAAVDDFDLF